MVCGGTSAVNLVPSNSKPIWGCHLYFLGKYHPPTFMPYVPEFSNQRPLPLASTGSNPKGVVAHVNRAVVSAWKAHPPNPPTENSQFRSAAAGVAATSTHVIARLHCKARRMMILPSDEQRLASLYRKDGKGPAITRFLRSGDYGIFRRKFSLFL